MFSFPVSGPVCALYALAGSVFLFCLFVFYLVFTLLSFSLLYERPRTHTDARSQTHATVAVVYSCNAFFFCEDILLRTSPLCISSHPVTRFLLFVFFLLPLRSNGSKRAAFLHLNCAPYFLFPPPSSSISSTCFKTKN